MRNPDEQQIALECLRLANCESATTDKLVERAAAFYAFVSGGDSASKVRQAASE